MEHTPLLMHPPEIPEAPKEVYARRWWLLFVLSAVSFEQVRAPLLVSMLTRTGLDLERLGTHRTVRQVCVRLDGRHHCAHGELGL